MRDRDVAVLDRRAAGYETRRIGRMHQRIVESVAGIALATVPSPTRILDVGCGTGAMVRLLAERLPSADILMGIDPAPAMIRAATLLTAAGFPSQTWHPSPLIQTVVAH